MDTEQTTRADVLRAQILGLVTEYHAEAFPERPFVGGISNVPVSGKVFNDHEIRLLVEEAPTHAARFERLASSGYFDGLTFYFCSELISLPFINR